METIKNDHKYFDKLMYFIDRELTSNGGCNHSFDAFNWACKHFEHFTGIKVDYENTLEYFKSRGGYCDCEILMNVPAFERVTVQPLLN